MDFNEVIAHTLLKRRNIFTQTIEELEQVKDLLSKELKDIVIAVDKLLSEGEELKGERIKIELLKENKKEAAKIVEQALKINLSELSDTELLNQITSWVTKKKLKKILLNVAEEISLEESEIDNIVERAIKDLMNLSVRNSSRDELDIESKEQLAFGVYNRLKLFAREFISGFPTLDKKLPMHRGTVAVLLGAPGRGKTINLLNFAIRNALAGKRVLFFALESDLAFYGLKALSITLANKGYEKEIDWIKEHPQEVLKHINGDLFPGKLKLVYQPPGTLTTADIRQYLNNERIKGNNYDMVVIDYLGLMKERGLKGDSGTTMFLKYDNITKSLANVAKEMRMFVLTAQQFNRGGIRKGAATDLSDTAGSVAIPANVDFQLHLSFFGNVIVKRNGNGRYEPSTVEQGGMFSKLIAISVKKNRFGEVEFIVPVLILPSLKTEEISMNDFANLMSFAKKEFGFSIEEGNGNE